MRRMATPEPSLAPAPHRLSMRRHADDFARAAGPVPQDA
jgi:hypothetical protein